VALLFNFCTRSELNTSMCLRRCVHSGVGITVVCFGSDFVDSKHPF